MTSPKNFELIPAIDLKAGHCVRLKQGRMDDASDYGNDPAAMALKWQSQGAKRMHLVDLDGAFSGQPENRSAIQSICQSLSIPVQLGGGLRDLQSIESTLKLGVDRVILGSIAVSKPELIAQACQQFPGQICVGIDARDGMVAIHGWDNVTRHRAIDLAQQFENDGVSAIIYTDIARDGMLSGPNIEETLTLAQSVSIPIIASGGVSRSEDVLKLSQYYQHGLVAAITGRAIYEGKLDFAATSLAIATQC